MDFQISLNKTILVKQLPIFKKPENRKKVFGPITVPLH